jgi:hypothetical protein
LDCGSGRDKEPSGEEVLRLIQIRLATLNLEKSWQLVKGKYRASPDTRLTRWIALTIQRRAFTNAANLAGSLADCLKLIDGRANVRQVDFNARFRQPRQFHPPVTWAVIRVYDEAAT